MTTPTDAEYVGRIERSVAAAARAGTIQLCIGVALLIGGLVLVVLVQRFLGNMVSEDVGLGLALGVMLGFKFGLIVIAGPAAIYQGVALLRGDRTEQLLVKYFDLATSDGRAACSEPSDSSAVATPSEGEDPR